MYINNKHTSGQAKGTISILNPATEEVLEKVPRSYSRRYPNRLWKRPKTAFQEWKRIPANDKAAALHQVATKIRDNHDDIVRLLTLEEGKPVPENEEELWWCEETFDYYAELARHERGRVIPPADPGQFTFCCLKNLSA